jgi:hypothetical protein
VLFMNLAISLVEISLKRTDSGDLLKGLIIFIRLLRLFSSLKDLFSNLWNLSNSDFITHFGFRYFGGYTSTPLSSKIGFFWLGSRS